MRITIAALADYANIAEGGKLNLSGVFDVIWVKETPIIHPFMVLALRMEFEYEDGDSDHVLVVSLRDMDGRELLRAEAKVGVPHIAPGTQGVSNQILRFAGIQIEGFGKLHFEILWDGEEKERVYLSISRLPSDG